MSKDTSSEPTLADMNERRVSAPVAAHRCKARTRDLWQCSKTPILGSAFCGIHTKNRSLRHGRVENSVPQRLREEFFRTGHKRIKQGSTLKRYSRRSMWEFTERIGKDCVEALNNVKFIDGLHAVHTHFDKHPPLRVSWKLKPQMGPQTLDDTSNEEELNLPRRTSCLQILRPRCLS